MLWFCSLFELPNSESAHQPLISNTKKEKFLNFAFLLLKFRSILFINFHVIFRKLQSLTHLLGFKLVCGSATLDWKKAVCKFLFQRYFLNCLGSIQEVTTGWQAVSSRHARPSGMHASSRALEELDKLDEEAE